MGFFKKLIKQSIGLGANHLLNLGNSVSSGMFGKGVNYVVNGMDRNAGLIGKLIKDAGQNYFSYNTRKNISNFADKAIKYIPKGKVRTALEKIKSAAQQQYNNPSQSSDPISTMHPKISSVTNPTFLTRISNDNQWKDEYNNIKSNFNKQLDSTLPTSLLKSGKY
ncbi:hypothetical protein M9Y10_004649 [Tritrichomonas musculus]|uniref:Uncharacterized protein n=1 Tax=Tritrichomonas musculus TaxID=1915356 RepID=A0ABR2JKC5_9EUKA